MGAADKVTRHKLSIEDYRRMGRAGILNEDSRVELIEGELIDMAPIGSLHASIVNRLTAFFFRKAADHAIVSTQNSLSLPPDSEPQPDIVLLKPRADWYRDALPTAADVLLVVEIADTTIGYDRDVKIPLYARHGIPEVWLVDVQDETIELYLEPGTSGYRKILRPELNETISPSLLDAVHLSLNELWRS